MERSQPSIFEIVLEDLLILKAQHENSMRSLNESLNLRRGGGAMKQEQAETSVAPPKDSNLSPLDIELQNIKMAAAVQTQQKQLYYPAHHSFLLGREVAARPKVREIGSEHWKGSEEEKDELRRILWR